MNWNLGAEVLGFLSGAVLLLPAVAQNASLRNAWLMMKRFRMSRTGLGRTMRQSETVKTATLPRWSPFDQWMLTAGVVLLLVSFGIKLALLLNWLA
jgi:hypothetical protein